MSTVHIAAEFSREDLLKAVEQLSPPEFSQFVSHVLALRARREASSLPATESQWFVRINQGLPEELSRRYDELIAKRQDGTLNQAELEELLRLSDDVESLEADRMEALASIARVRGVSLTSLMTDLGIPEPSHE